MPKAGSTALQAGLAAARDRLARQGILYPRGPLVSRSHNFLIAGVQERKQKLPRLLRNAYIGRLDEVEPAFAAWMAELRSSIAARRPETLVLSSEWLFRLRADSQFERLREVLLRLGDSVEAVAYVRRPSDQYLSSAQQILKGSHVIKPVAPIRYRTTIEGFARIADRLHVVRYDRADFPGGDIVRHFLLTFLPEAGEIGAGGGDNDANATISAEGMSILAAYRRINHRRRRNRFTADTDRLLDAIRGADRQVGGDLRPRLLGHVRDEIDHGSSDILWLRDAHGVVFDGIDYGAVAAPTLPFHELKRRPKRIEEICVIDPARREKLLMRAMHALAADSPAKAPEQWRRISRWLGLGGASGRR